VVRPASIFGFRGPNGAGKITTLRMLATLLPPTSGNVAPVGVPIHRSWPSGRAANWPTMEVHHRETGEIRQSSVLYSFEPALGAHGTPAL